MTCTNICCRHTTWGQSRWPILLPHFFYPFLRLVFLLGCSVIDYRGTIAEEQAIGDFRVDVLICPEDPEKTCRLFDVLVVVLREI